MKLIEKKRRIVEVRIQKVEFKEEGRIKRIIRNGEEKGNGIRIDCAGPRRDADEQR